MGYRGGGGSGRRVGGDCAAARASDSYRATGWQIGDDSKSNNVTLVLCSRNSYLGAQCRYFLIFGIVIKEGF